LWVRIPLSWGVLDTILWDKVFQWLATGRWFSPGTPISSNNKTDHHNATELLLKVALNTGLSITKSNSLAGTDYPSGKPKFIFSDVSVAQSLIFCVFLSTILSFIFKPLHCHWICKLQKGRIRLAAASDKVYQLLVHGRWFSPASSTTKTGLHDITEILLEVATCGCESNAPFL
jgi:hypothetical protein